MTVLMRRYALLALVAVLFAAAFLSGAWRFLSLDALQAHHAALEAYVAAHPILALGAYVGLYCLVVIACIPGPSVMSLAGGFLFGIWIGGSAALASCVLGSIVVFLACRTAFGDWAAARAGPRLRRVQARFAQNGFGAVLTLRLVPMLPISFTTLAAGLGGASLPAMTAGTALGSAPISFIFAGLGAGLGEIFHRGGRLDATLFQRPEIILPLVGLALLSVAPLAWRLLRKPAASPQEKN